MGQCVSDRSSAETRDKISLSSGRTGPPSVPDCADRVSSMRGRHQPLFPSSNESRSRAEPASMISAIKRPYAAPSNALWNGVLSGPLLSNRRLAWPVLISRLFESSSLIRSISSFSARNVAQSPSKPAYFLLAALRRSLSSAPCSSTCRSLAPSLA